jgi:hypothetical protein
MPFREKDLDLRASRSVKELLITLDCYKMDSSHKLESIFVRGKISFRAWKTKEVALAVSADGGRHPGQPL